MKKNDMKIFEIGSKRTIQAQQSIDLARPEPHSRRLFNTRAIKDQVARLLHNLVPKREMHQRQLDLQCSNNNRYVARRARDHDVKILG